jgi:cytoskeletal protein RodZ
MKNILQKGSSTVILLIIVIIVLLGVIGYSYFKTTQSKDFENTSQTTADQQEVGEPIKNTPKVFETTNINNTVPELLAYSGKTSSGINFTIKYPSSWTYYKFSCNADGVAFWPKTNAPDFSKGGACGMNSFLDGAPIVVSTMSQPQIQLRNDNYKIIFDQMKTSLSY